MPAALHTRIADRLRDQIRSGALAEGDPLPSEAVLRDEWGASRGPVRQALATLRSEGIVTGGQGRRAVVSRPPLAQPFDSLLSYSAWAESIGSRPGQRTLELALRPADPLAAQRLAVAPGTPVVEELRLRLLDGVPAMIERTTYPEHVGRMLFDFDTDSGSEWAHLETRGVEFASASHVIDAIAADETDARLLEVPVGAPLLRQERITRNPAGDIVEYDDDRYLPGLVRFSLENAPAQRSALALSAPAGVGGSVAPIGPDASQG